MTMLTKTQQSVYRPMVEKAWIAHCRLTGSSPNNKADRDAWYRDQVHSCTGQWSTRDADPERDYQVLLDRFMLLAGDPQPLVVIGWSDSQNRWFSRAAQDAWNVAISSGAIEEGTGFRDWINGILSESGVSDHAAKGKLESFDAVMASLAVIANDERMMTHFSAASERRMRWQIRRFMGDLEWLERRPVGWDYVSAIWTQAELLPALDEAPAATLHKVLMMLDTHIRRLCERAGIRPRDIPSRV